ncbi:MAG: SDR family oxidoreductase [Planctomycetia bacterium]|nr:SDR family oxidoreductase [Planctomycetia bacterium]
MKNRICLVTGAGRGIGRASAVALAKNGGRVALTARSQDEIKSAAAEIRAVGGQALPIVADLSDRKEPARIVAEVKKSWGPIEVLVNNAGIGSSQDPRPLVEFDDAFWDLTFAVNVTAPYLFTKLVLPDMIARRWGRIINIASINAKLPGLHAAAYTASKHAIAGLTKAAALEVSSHGITVNAVCPGVTRSRMNDKRLQYDEKRTGTSFAQLEKEASLLGRRLEPEEVASLVAFLASEDAAAITGQAINVCGGKLLAC